MSSGILRRHRFVAADGGIARQRGSRVEHNASPARGLRGRETDDDSRRPAATILETLFATPEIVAERRADGSIWLKSTVPLQQSARCVGDWLEHWARQTPERDFSRRALRR